MEYKVLIRETLERIIIVENDNKEDAKEKIKGLYRDGQIVLDYRDFTGTEFLDYDEI